MLQPLARNAALITFLMACSKTEQAPAPAPTFTTTALQCFLPAGTPMSQHSDDSATFNMSGPNWCARVLQLFLQEQPTLHIVSILPLEYPLEAVRHPGQGPQDGTQELLVVHADRGRWPKAGDLEVDAHLCTDDVSFGPSHCAETLAKHLPHAPDIEFLVPLVRNWKGQNLASGTTDLVLVQRRETVQK